MSIDFNRLIDILITNWPMFLHGIYMTVIFALVGTIFGFIIGLIVGGLRTIEINGCIFE